MTSPEDPLKVAMAIIINQNGYILENRKDGSANGAVGKLGCFGGRVDIGESPEQAVVREVTQEETTGLEDFTISEFRRLGAVAVKSDRNGLPANVEAEVFQLYIPPGIEVKGKDGREAVILDLGRIVAHKHKGELTPATFAAVEKFYGL